MRDTLLRGGLESPTNYYKVMLENGNLSDYQGTRHSPPFRQRPRAHHFREPTETPEESWHIKKPALFIATTRDYVCLAPQGKMTMEKYAPHADIVELTTGHWAHLEATAEVNDALEKWVGKL